MPELRTNRFPSCQRGECGIASPVVTVSPGGHVEHGAAVVARLAPPARFVGRGHHGDEGRGSVSHRQAVEVAAVLRGQLGDERRPPARHEAVAGVEAGQAGEQGVDDPQVRLAAVGGPPRDLVALDRAGDGRGARQPAPVVAAGGRDRGGELGVVAQRPDLPLAPHRDPVRSDGDTHGPVEPAEGEGQLPVGHTDGHELAGLIGRDQQRTPGLLEHARETGRCGGTGPPSSPASRSSRDAASASGTASPALTSASACTADHAAAGAAARGEGEPRLDPQPAGPA